MPKEKKGILSVILNGDNPVKVSKKQAGKLRSFFKKIAGGLKTVPYIPGAIFKEVVERKKAKKEAKEKDEEYVPFAERVEKRIQDILNKRGNTNTDVNETGDMKKENVSSDEEEKVDVKKEKTDDKVNVSSDEKEKKVNQESTVTKKMDLEEKGTKILTGQKLSDLAEKYNQEHKPVKPIEFDVHQEDLETTNNQEIGEDYKPDRTKLDELIEKYGDLTKFVSWDDYYNSLSEKKLKEMTRKGTLLQENVFIDIRMLQAEEYIRIDEEKEASRQVKRARLVSEEKDRQAKREANREEKKELNRRIAEIDREQEKLADEIKAYKNEIKTLAKETDECKAEIEAMKKITSREAKDADVKSPIQAKEDEIMQKIRENVYGKDTKKPEKTIVALEGEKKDPIQTENSVETERTSDNDETKIEQDGTIAVSPIEPEKVESEKVDDSKNIFGLPDLDTQDDLVSEISDPNTFNNDSEEAAPAGLDYMGFDPQTRSELGQEAFDRWKNSDGAQSFIEIKNELADKYNAVGKGKTR